MYEIEISEASYQIESDVRDVVERQLNGRAQSQGSPERVMFHFECRSIHRWMVEASVEGYRFLSDEGAHQGGSAVAPAPLRYFVGGMAIAVQIWIVKMAAVAGVELTSVRCAADPYLQSGPYDASVGRGFERIVLTFDLKSSPEAPDDSVLQVVGDALLASPASVTLAKAVNLQSRVIHNGRLIKDI